MSTDNPFATPNAPSTPTLGQGVDNGLDVSLVARRHRRLNLIVLANIVLFVGFMVMSMSLRGSETVGALAVGVWGLMLALSIGLAVTLLQLGLALGWESWKVALAFLGLFIGLVNLIIIISAISRGNAVLKQAGLRVGFLGVAPSELEAWRRQQGLPGYA